MVTTTTGIATNFIQFSRTSLATVTNNVGNIAWAGHNLLTNSESFDAAAWVKTGATVTANATVAPNGTTTADKLLEQTGTSFHGLYQGGGVITSIPVTFSVFVKGDLGRDWVRISYDGGGSKTAWFNVTNGTIGTVNAGLTASPPQLVGNGFYLIRISFTGASFGNVAIGPAISDNVDSYTGDASKGVTIWGAALYRSDLGGMVFNPAQPAGFGTYYPTTPLNLMESTEDFSSGYWGGKTRITITKTSVLAPNGIGYGYKVNPTGNSANDSFFYELRPLVGGTPYTFTTYIQDAGLGWACIFIGGTAIAGAFFNLATGTPGSVVGSATGKSSTIVYVGNGWYRCSLTANAPSTTSYAVGYGLAEGDNDLVFSSGTTNGIYLWGAQLSDSASVDPYFPVYAAGLTSSAYYAPRLDYDPVSVQPRGLLVEEQRTNTIVSSANFSAGNWVVDGVSLTASATVAPDGSLSGTSIVAGTGNNRLLYFDNSNITGNKVFSIYVKPNAGSSLSINTTGGMSPSGPAVINASTGVVTGFSGASSIAVGNGWYRVFLPVSVTTASGNSTYWTINGPASSVFIWGAQLEAGSFASSYIPTSASSETRSSDVASVFTQAFPYGTSAGSWVAFGSALSNASPLANRYVIGNTSENAYILYTNAGDTVIRSFDGANLLSSSVGNFASANKYASAYGGGSKDLCVNGGIVSTVSYNGNWSSSTQLYLGSSGSGGQGSFYGHIRQITYIPRRLTNAELQTRTT